MAKHALVLACIAALACSATAARHLQQAQQTCPLSETTELDFVPVASACDPTKADFCASCICSLTDIFLPAFRAAGLTLDPADPSSFPIDRATTIIAACTQQYFVSLLLAEVNVTAIEQLSTCGFNSAASVPPCLADKIATLSAADPAVAASARAADPAAVPAATDDDLTYYLDDDEQAAATTAAAAAAAAAAPSPLRIATVYANGPMLNVTLAGQLDSARQLVAAMLASADLMAVMTPAQQDVLRAIQAAPEAFEADPRTNAYLATLTNPVDAAALLTKFQEIQASPEVAAATPADAATIPAAEATPVETPAVVAAAPPTTTAEAMTPAVAPAVAAEPMAPAAEPMAEPAAAPVSSAMQGAAAAASSLLGAALLALAVMA